MSYAYQMSKTETKQWDNDSPTKYAVPPTGIRASRCRQVTKEIARWRASQHDYNKVDIFGVDGDLRETINV